MNENVIEWLRGDDVATVTLCSNSRYNNKVRKLSEEYPGEIKIVEENSDGSIVAHIPLKFIKIAAPRKLSEEQVEAFKERMKKREV